MSDEKKKDQVRIIARSDASAIAVRSNDKGDTLVQLERMGNEVDPTAGEYMALEKTEDPDVYNAKVLTNTIKAGPAKVNSKAFKAGWANIFGTSKGSKEMN